MAGISVTRPLPALGQAEAQPPVHADVPIIAGCQIFPQDNVWNTRVDRLPMAANSNELVASIGSSTSVHPDFGTFWDGDTIGFLYNLVPGDQALVPISFYYDEDSDPGPYPIPPNPVIEGGSDRHILIVDKDHCVLYEIFDAGQNQDGTWNAGSGAIFPLDSNLLRQDTWTSADAAGLPILPGLVRYEEIAAGHIDHALRFTAPETTGYIWPGRHDATTGDGPPLGMRFRLKAGFDISPFPPEVRVLLTALKTYGMFLADNGSPWYISGVHDVRWDDSLWVDALRDVHGYDFEAVDESSIIIHPDSAQARQPIPLEPAVWLPYLDK